MIQENLAQVRQNIVNACKKSGRSPEEVTLIAVSKTKPVEAIYEAMSAEQTVFGENKVQEIMDKYPALPKSVQWHMIGHLQRNKVKYIVDKVKMIHSVDSLRLAKQISTEAVKAGVTMPILLEVNVAEEESKFGYRLEEVENELMEIAKLPGIVVKGFMTIAPFVEDPEENRWVFRKLYQFAVDMKVKTIDNVIIEELSMGMTNDYEVAIEEGATMVRVGTGIFGSR